MNETTVTMQMIIFALSCILGIVLGVLYDIFRIIRMVINSKSIAIFIGDIIYFIISGIITFIFVLKINSGESRFYIMAGEGIGWIAYHLTLGNAIYKYSEKATKKINFYTKKIIKKIFKDKNDNIIFTGCVNKIY